MERFDVAVVGAGFAGLSAAKTYLQCAPDTHLVLFDSDTTLGGTWSQQRLYPGVCTNNQYGTFEFPDFPMHQGYGVKKGSHIPGEVAHRYLNDYTDHFGITKRLRLNSKVISATKLDNGTWKLRIEALQPETCQHSEYDAICDKIILATGLTSQAPAPQIAGQEEFGGPIFNATKLASTGIEVLKTTPDDERHITVLGGGKSAYDAVYMFASKGFQVNWVIRKSGYGPTWMAPSHLAAGPFKVWLEMVPNIRLLSWFSPCMMGKQSSWFSRFLHKTWLGQRLVRAFWNKFDTNLVAQTNLRSSPQLEKLIPDESCFWYATSLAIFTYETDIHDFVRSGQVNIYREDISHLSSKTVHLANGTSLDSPAGLMVSTRWSWAPNIDIQPASLHAKLGIPSSEYTNEDKQFWSKLVSDADRTILSQFPVLKEASRIGHKPTQHDTATSNGENAKTKANSPVDKYHLYRFLAPANGDTTIAFQGYVVNLTNHIRNELAALWIYAYLNNKLDYLPPPTTTTPISPTRSSTSSPPRNKAPSPVTTFTSAALENRFWSWRYPMGFGSWFPDLAFEHVPYYDQLMTDLGLAARRKRGGTRLGRWVKELVEPYGQTEYRGVTEEWLNVKKGKEGVGAV